MVGVPRSFRQPAGADECRVAIARSKGRCGTPVRLQSTISIAIVRLLIENSATNDPMRQAPPALSTSGFGSAWFALCFAFALHIVDEASTGFLAVYNPTVIVMRQRWGWFPMPTFEFREWLVGLILGCGLLFCLTPVAARGLRSLRPLAWVYAAIMFFNGLGHTIATVLGHTVASVTFPRPAPGFYSSPFLFAGSLWLMARLRHTAKVEFQLPTSD